MQHDVPCMEMEDLTPVWGFLLESITAVARRKKGSLRFEVSSGTKGSGEFWISLRFERFPREGSFQTGHQLVIIRRGDSVNDILRMLREAVVNVQNEGVYQYPLILRAR